VTRADGVQDTVLILRSQVPDTEISGDSRSHTTASLSTPLPWLKPPKAYQSGAGP